MDKGSRFDPNDDSVELLQTSAAEADVIAMRLRSEGIPATVFGGRSPSGPLELGLRTLGARVLVRRGDAQRAAILVKDLFDRT